MINCPKCNFTQPEDKYCASCGIDMSLYKPKAAPWHIKLAKNTYFQVALLLAVMFAGISYSRVQRQAELQSRIENIENAREASVVEKKLDVGQAEAASESAVVSETSVTDASAELGTSTSALESQSLSTATAPVTDQAKSSEAAAVGGDASASAQPASTAPTSVLIHLVAMSAEKLDELEKAASGSAHRYGRVFAASFADWEKHFKTSLNDPPSVEELEQVSPYGLIAGQSFPFIHLWPAGTATAGRSTAASGAQTVGLRFEAKPVKISETGTTLAIDLSRAWKEPKLAQITEQPLPKNLRLDIPKKGGAFIAGLFPQREVFEDDVRVYSQSRALQLLLDPDYVSGRVDLVVLIDVE